MMDKRSRNLIILIVGLFLLAGIALFILGYIAIDAPVVARFQDDFEKIQVGTSKAEVLELLGKPDNTGTTFRLGQYEGFEDKYRKASESGAKHYYFWYRGSDFVFTIGFDGNDRVVIAEYGGT